jgi:hypothetical protein
MNYKTISSEETAPPRARDADVIAWDIPRCTAWFAKLAEDFGVPANLTSEAEAIIMRVVHKILTHHNFAYYQGFDRFVFISYLIGLKFVAILELSRFEAEAIAFALSVRFYEVADFPQYLRPETFQRFVSLDEEVAFVRPDIARDLSRGGHSAVHYAHRWKLLWFADEHTIDGICLIWDNILGRLPDLQTYLEKLCVAHVMQIQLRSDNFALEVIQAYTNWDVPKILGDAERIGLTRDAVVNLDPENPLRRTERVQTDHMRRVGRVLRTYWPVVVFVLVIGAYIITHF